MVRRTVFYSGRVQGVGFRYTADRLARGQSVTGFVRNLPDGRVELVAEGNERDVDQLLKAIMDHYGADITDAGTDASPATGEFDRFEIRR